MLSKSGNIKPWTLKPTVQNIHIISLLPPCVRTGVLYKKWKGGGPEGSGLTGRRLASHDWHDEHWGEGQSGLAPPQWLSRVVEN